MKKRIGSDLDTIPVRVHGIPCQIHIISFEKVEPFRSQDSREDWLGGEEMEWELEDRQGYKAPWLEGKLNLNERRQIEATIRGWCHG